GLDRALLASSGDAPASTISRGLRCFVVAIGEDGLHAGRALVRELREGGVATEAALEPRPLKAQLRMADRSGADLALIVGPGEVDRGVVTVKRLADQLQRELPRDELVGAIHRGD